MPRDAVPILSGTKESCILLLIQLSERGILASAIFSATAPDERGTDRPAGCRGGVKLGRGVDEPPLAPKGIAVCHAGLPTSRSTFSLKSVE